MTDLGHLRYFLGMKIDQTAVEIFLLQTSYARKLLNKFNMHDCKPVDISLAVREKLSKLDRAVLINATQYKRLVGSFLYLTATRPNLMFVTSLLFRYM